MKVSRNFYLQEFIDKETFRLYGEKALRFLDPRLIPFMQKVRDHLETPIIINDWHTGGHLQYRGFRPFMWPLQNKKLLNLTEKEIAGVNFYSQHKYGRAVDFDVCGIPADTVRGILIDQVKLGKFKDLKGLELEVSWVHVDLRNSENLVCFNA